MKSMYDTYLLNDGNPIPCMAFGTYIPSAQEQVQRKMIGDAIEVGYRYFDTASLYESERDLGNAVKDSGIDRKEFYIATKVWIDEMDEMPLALERSLGRLQTDYVDLYLCHWPKKENDPDWKERVRKTWSQMEEAVEKGYVKSIGFSNFLPHHAEVVLQDCKIKPVVDQLELHPGYSQYYARSFCKENGIIPQAWSPLGRGNSTGSEDKYRLYFEELGKKYGKSASQVLLRFLVQNGIIPIVKSKTPERMKENADIFDFALDREDMHMLESMPQNTWLGEHPDFFVPTAKCSREQ